MVKGVLLISIHLLSDQARRIRAAQRLIEDGDKHYEEDRQRLQEELTDIQEENRDVRSVLRVVLKEQGLSSVANNFLPFSSKSFLLLQTAVLQNQVDRQIR